MDNKDFWQSIHGIISQGFLPENLTKLDEYAEWFITKRLVYKRFSPAEQYGCIAGGATHVIASILAGAEVEANKLSAPVGSFKRELECGKAQTEHIECWAKTTGVWIDDTDVYMSQTFGDHIAEGGEARVYDNGPGVIKTIGLDYFVLPELALDRISLHNTYFPQTAMRVLGFGRDSDGAFQIIVEQPFIQGEKMQHEEIKDYAEKLGYKIINPKNWTYATPEIYLSDMHDENVIRSSKGNIFVIDCDIRINVPELKAGGTRKLTNEIDFVEFTPKTF